MTTHFLQHINRITRHKLPVVGRYAPSPSGPQHMGNLRAALLSWLQARVAGGKFLLRFDDLDAPRVKAGSQTQIQQELVWLGLDWDGDVIFQSQRLERYQALFDELQAASAVYPCYCSRKDIEEALSEPRAENEALRYSGKCRHLKEVVSDKPAAWRFQLAAGSIAFEDRLLGHQNYSMTDLGDFVIKRKDGLFAYQMACAVDDLDFGVTDVVRGSDLLGSTPLQLSLIQALGADSPQFWHLPLLNNSSGEKLSKRDGSDSIQSLRDSGLSAEQLIAQTAVSMGLIGPDIKQISAQALLYQIRQYGNPSND